MAGPHLVVLRAASRSVLWGLGDAGDPTRENCTISVALQNYNESFL